MNLKLSKKWLIIFVIIIAAGLFLYKFSFKDQTIKTEYVTVPIKKGIIEKKVEASGTINPVNIVNVGTQVSGIIKKIYIDFNDQVKKGQLLAELDKSVLLANKETAEAKMDKAKTQKKLAALEVKRLKELFAKDYIAQAELDQAETKLKSLEADYNSAYSEYKKAKTNLSYAIIRSPVSGVVISREVDEGQTVSASLQAPELFKIAEDLTKMQIETSVSESDIGTIRPGQEVYFTVDAYQNEIFKGKVKQIRLNPVNEENVVTYTVIINIDNSSMKLLPGMTAFTTILINHKENTLKVANTVFAFKWPEEDTKPKEKEKKSPLETTIYLLKNESLVPVKIKKGISNDTETEISGPGITENDLVVEDILGSNLDLKNNKNSDRAQRLLLRRGLSSKRK
jgi:HlyD family secretion protein